MGKKINLLITGPLGHIGSKFIRSISDETGIASVTMIDNFLTLRYPSLFNLPESLKFRFIEGDLMTYDFDHILKDIDVVLHLAAITDAANSFENEQKVFTVNFDGTKRISEACARNSVPLIFISTTSVYGTQNKIVDENCTIDELQPQSPYAKSKLLAEGYLKELSQMDKSFRYVICRFGTIYGISVGMRFHTAVNKFCWQACAGVPITVWSTALNQKRPYLDLNDAINALNFIIKNSVYNNEIYNVLTENVTVKEIIDAISTHIHDIRIEYVESPIMNQLSYEVSNQKFKTIGFKSNGILNDGIKETISLIRGIRN